MTIQELIRQDQFEIINEGSDLSREITEPFCCDLLSVAMGNAPAGCAWCTVMANMKMKAASEGITLLRTDRGIFETALGIYRNLHEKDQL